MRMMYILHQMRGWEDDSVGKVLPYKREDLSPICGTHIKNLGRLVATCNPGAGDVETGEHVMSLHMTASTQNAC